MTKRTIIDDIAPLGPELDEGQLGMVAGARPRFPQTHGVDENGKRYVDYIA